jgi:hypothetical protein
VEHIQSIAINKSKIVSWSGYLAIDNEESNTGLAMTPAKPREKISDVKRMLKIGLERVASSTQREQAI